MCGGGETLAILGAGNCNDVDLELLGGQFEEIHLVDIDRAAIERARQWQVAGVKSSLVTHAPVDLSGCLEVLPRYRNEVPNLAELAQWSKNAASRAFGAVTMTFDTVASVCMLSQLMHACAVGLGVEHPCLQVIACATAVAHLRSLVRMVRPGGTAILITDVVSSETFAFEERVARGADPLDVLAQIDNEGASFTCTSRRSRSRSWRATRRSLRQSSRRGWPARGAGGSTTTFAISSTRSWPRRSRRPDARDQGRARRSSFGPPLSLGRAPNRRAA